MTELKNKFYQGEGRGGGEREREPLYNNSIYKTFVSVGLS
jgi:hypothetical protein